MENQTQQSRRTRVLYSALLFIIGIALGAVLFLHCEGKKQTNTGNELQNQYNNLELKYIGLQNSKTKTEHELKIAKAKLIAVIENHKKELVNYGKSYIKGRDIIINNPCKDSLHLAAYDSLNASCERTQAKADEVYEQSVFLMDKMQSKISILDSTVNNRNEVIKLDRISIAATRDTLSQVRQSVKKRVIKSFFIGFGLGAAAREAVGVIGKLSR